jgi:ribosomal protein S18 acetylase RimI-like enzyme
MPQLEELSGHPGPATVEVRKYTAADRNALIDVMARAFDDDPMANWFAAQDSHRSRRIHDFISMGVKMTAPHDEAYTTDGVLGGAAWVPPGKAKMGVLRQLMLLPSMVRVCTARRLPAILGGLNAVEKKHPYEPHWYLLAVGVDPDQQGRGIGTQLMRPGLERCDREGTPAYLESSNERNVPLYERNGFKVTEVFQVPNGGPKIWLMWRDPQ